MHICVLDSGPLWPSALWGQQEGTEQVGDWGIQSTDSASETDSSPLMPTEEYLNGEDTRTKAVYVQDPKSKQSTATSPLYHGDEAL